MTAAESAFLAVLVAASLVAAALVVLYVHVGWGF